MSLSDVSDKDPSPTDDITVGQGTSHDQALTSPNGNNDPLNGDEEIEELGDDIEKLKELLTIKQAELDDLTRGLMEHREICYLSDKDESRVSSAGQQSSEPTDLSPARSLVRPAAEVILKVAIRISGKVRRSTMDFDLCAADCCALNYLRASIIAAGAEGGRLQKATLWMEDDIQLMMRDLNRVTFKLEEDGHVAKMSITRTKVDRSCAFPETEYKAWFYRNVARGKLDAYTVEVDIEV